MEGEAASQPVTGPSGICFAFHWVKDSTGKLAEGVYAAVEKNLACFINSFYYLFSMTTTVTSKNMITIPMEIARKFGVKPGFSFDWFDTGRPDEIAIRVIPDRKELSRRLKGAGKSYSPLRDSVHELLQERSEEMA